MDIINLQKIVLYVIRWVYMPFHHAHVLSRIQRMVLCHIMPAQNGFSFTFMFVCLLVYVNVFNLLHRS